MDMEKNTSLDINDVKIAVKEAFTKALNGFKVKEVSDKKFTVNLDEANSGAKIGIEVWDRRPNDKDSVAIYMAFLLGNENIGPSMYSGFADIKRIIPGEHRYGYLKDIDALKNFIIKVFVPNVLKILNYVKNSDKPLIPNPKFMDYFRQAASMRTNVDFDIAKGNLFVKSKKKSYHQNFEYIF